MVINLTFAQNQSTIELLVWICGMAIGTIIGLMGGGGAILAMPVMVYLMHFEPKLAAAYSLFVVGISALTGSIRHIIRKEISYLSILFFAIPGMTVSFLTRRFVIPSIPEFITFGSGFKIESNVIIMILFALIMFVAGVSMLLKKSEKPRKRLLPLHLSWLAISSWGVVVGFISGMVGAGGGFMIIPILVLLMELPVKTAMGTSLAIIAIQSLTGFSGDLLAHTSIDWNFLLKFSAVALGGMLIGSSIAKKSQPAKLKRAFGVFVMVMGIMIVAMELNRPNHQNQQGNQASKYFIFSTNQNYIFSISE